MSMPFYVAPEQVMKDRADYARKGIARGRSLAALSYDNGILICAENPSRTLHKVAEIYDRIAFAGVGKFSEFDSLRTSRVRLADVKGYTYSREDVAARSLANAYGQKVRTKTTAAMARIAPRMIHSSRGVGPAAGSSGSSKADSTSSTIRSSWASARSSWPTKTWTSPMG